MFDKEESDLINAMVKHGLCVDEVGTIRFLNTMATSGRDSESYCYSQSMMNIRQEDNAVQYWIAAVIRHINKRFTNPPTVLFIPNLPTDDLLDFNKEVVRRYLLAYLNKALKKCGLRAELTLHALEEPIEEIEKTAEVKDKTFNKLFKVK